MPHVTAAKVGAFATLLGVGVAALGLPAAAAPRPGHPARHAQHTKAQSVDPKLSRRISAVNAALDRLARQSDQLDEQYNVASAAVDAARRGAELAQRQAQQAEAQYQTAHQRFLQAVTQQYENGATASIGTLLTSDAPQRYLDSLTLANYLSTQFAAITHAEQAAHLRARQAAARATAALQTARVKEAALAERRAALQRQSQRFQQLLDTLTARQRRERAHALAVAAARARAEAATTAPPRRHGSPPTGTGPVSAQVQRVIAFAEAQVGKAYAYGAAGPSAYDCSGLTMAAWAQVGVHLPHSAAEQYNYGTHVSYSQLQPGDLIFLYSPIGHVELYVGHDLAVSAADPSMGIVYVHPSQDLADYAGATRLLG